MLDATITDLHSFTGYEGIGFDLNQGRTELSPAAESKLGDCGQGWDVKVVVIGEAGVGKTSLLKRASHDEFDSNYKVTIGVDFEFLRYNVFGVPITLTCWDTAGQEKFASIARNYYNGAEAAVIVYDSNSPESFKKITTRWLPELKRSVPSDIPIFLIANKQDLVSFVDDAELASLAKAHRLEAYKSSVKDDALRASSTSPWMPIKQLFSRVACVMCERLLAREAAPQAVQQSNSRSAVKEKQPITLNSAPSSPSKKDRLPGCCK